MKLKFHHEFFEVIRKRKPHSNNYKAYHTQQESFEFIHGIGHKDQPSPFFQFVIQKIKLCQTEIIRQENSFCWCPRHCEVVKIF